jgi:hypothetical protein
MDSQIFRANRWQLKKRSLFIFSNSTEFSVLIFRVTGFSSGLWWHLPVERVDCSQKVFLAMGWQATNSAFV